MNWRKKYETDYERKIDQHRGFFVCLLVNSPLLIISLYMSHLLPQDIRLVLPWIVNIGIIILALIFRPEFTTGYLAFFAFVIVGTITLGVVFLAACFASMAAGFAVIWIHEALGMLAFYVVLAGVFFYLLPKISGPMWEQFKYWWHP